MMIRVVKRSIEQWLRSSFRRAPLIAPPRMKTRATLRPLLPLQQLGNRREHRLGRSVLIVSQSRKSAGVNLQALTAQVG